MKPVEIDLRRDLPKVRENWRKLIRQRGKCLYAAPCIIGVMIPENRRAALDIEIKPGCGSPNIGSLVDAQRVVVPEGQEDDFTDLQSEFDNCDAATIKRTLARLEAKYLRPVREKEPTNG